MSACPLDVIVGCDTTPRRTSKSGENVEKIRIQEKRNLDRIKSER